MNEYRITQWREGTNETIAEYVVIRATNKNEALETWRRKHDIENFVKIERLSPLKKDEIIVELSRLRNAEPNQENWDRLIFVIQSIYGELDYIK